MEFKNKLLVVATHNPGKIKEFRRLFDRLGIEIKSAGDFPDVPEVLEDGETFAENAEKKAKSIALALRLPALADDSGLCVDALHGEPGVRSARYAASQDGGKGSDDENNRKLLHELGRLGLQGKRIRPDDADSPVLWSTARFVCALALHDSATGRTIHVEGSCEGEIVDRPSGRNGFGYDPLFYLASYGKTMAELDMDEKNRISHRGQALRRMMAIMEHRAQ